MDSGCFFQRNWVALIAYQNATPISFGQDFHVHANLRNITLDGFIALFLLLHPVGVNCHVSGETVFYDLSFSDSWWILVGNNFSTHTLCQQEFFSKRDPTADLAPNRPYTLRNLLRSFWHTNCSSKGDWTLHTKIIYQRSRRRQRKKTNGCKNEIGRFKPQR